MQSPRHAFLYGAGVWVGLIVVSLVGLPFETGNEAWYESMKLCGLVALVLGFAILYLTRNQEGTAREGLVIGVLWAAICVALDLVLYAAGAFTIGLGTYFQDVASSYAAMPVITVLTLGFLHRRGAGKTAAAT
jgi:hypothetical protein